MGDSTWFQEGVIYQLHIRSFADGDGDGIGDFRGLIGKLDYLRRLGVTALWLLPFYPSPLKDDGYDIADYRSVNPAYGTLADFRRFLDAAHTAELRVITELVLNHTSDQHPWFQRARRAVPGSVERDYYVWRDSPEAYPDARIIFKDFEPSNWSWDPVAKAYFWHRFYSHQPDLNFENPAVHEALFDIIDFWLGMGVDGLRLDAVPYLYEREGTNCENLPETHAFLRKLRSHIDARHPGRMLLAEANQWPEDAAAYFGNGDECHMEFHFPLMPRLFMALQMEDRFPVIDILEQTPSIPPNCQWATFLRNHDELTLEMVTDEERDYMYRVYAEDPRARINLGIRRRLAPLLGNSRRRIELLNSLLFSLPGTPIIYYGDEIGMGDNFFLGDRNGVRTPMQWSPDRNAGFSQANPQQLFLPVIIDPEYHYEGVNVENQERNPTSLFWWMRRLIGIRNDLPALAHGEVEFLRCTNARVLAYVRRHGNDVVLALANLSRFAQRVEVDLHAFAGRVPLELFSRIRWEPLQAPPTIFTLGPHDFFWFSLLEAAPLPMNRSDEIPAATLAATPAFENVRFRELVEEEFLPVYLQRMRWFGGKGRTLRDTRIVEQIPLSDAERAARLLIVEVQYSDGLREQYQLFVILAEEAEATKVLSTNPSAGIARVSSPSGTFILYDALFHSPTREQLLRDLAAGGTRMGTATELEFVPGEYAAGLEASAANSAVIGVEQSNTSVKAGDRFFLKFYRRMEQGLNPDMELTRFLSEQQKFEHVPPFAGAILLHHQRETSVLGMLLGFTENQGDGWSYTLDAVTRFAERVLSEPNVAFDPLRLAELAGGVYPPRAQQLAERTAGMHLALAGETSEFAAEPFTSLYQRSLYQALRSAVRRSVASLRDGLDRLSKPASDLAQAIVDGEETLIGLHQGLREGRIHAAKTRIHGDYHLGQVLNTGKDFVIIDFEGEPKKPLSERRLKRSPLVDVAGMLRSFDYAAQMVLRNQHAADGPRLRPWLEGWSRMASDLFCEAYRSRMAGSGLLPEDAVGFNALLRSFVVDKALYEIGYELTYRPEMVEIPLRAVYQLIGPKT